MEQPISNQATSLIPLTGMEFDGQITSSFARIVCRQNFQNQSGKYIEAPYVFALPEEASVVFCEMRIGDRTVTAEIKELKQAQREYREVVDQGHQASLLEQRRSNIFSMSVGGIGPGEIIKAVLKYNQPVDWQDGGFRFTIPTVVAPRFIPGKLQGKTGGGWAENTDAVPDASQITPVVAKEGVPYRVKISLDIDPGFAAMIESPSHEFAVGKPEISAGEPPLHLELADLLPDRDFVLRYRAKAPVLQSAVHVGRFGDEEFALVTIFSSARRNPTPTDLILLLDVSGSMSGAKIEGLKLVASKVARNFLAAHSENRVGIVAFSEKPSPVCGLSDSTDKVAGAIEGLKAGGSTYAGRALDYCFGMFGDPNQAKERYILLVSDGQTEDDRWSKVTPGIRVVAVGIDAALNLDYLKQIAKDTGGTSYSIYPGEDYDTAANTLVGFLSGPVLRNIKIYPPIRSLGGLVKDLEPLADVMGVTDVYENMPARLMIRGTSIPSRLRVVAEGPGGETVEIYVDDENTREREYDFIHQIWAREKFRQGGLSDDEQIVLSLEHSVLCSKTAFVAVFLREVPGQRPERVEVPVMLPHTWDYDAVFGSQGSGGAFVFASTYDRSGVKGLLGGARDLGGFGGDRIKNYLDSIFNRLPTSADLAKTLPSAKHLVDQLEELLERYEKQGGISRQDLEREFKALLDQVSATAISGSWTLVQKVKALYLLLKAKTMGLNVSWKIMETLQREASNTASVLEAEVKEWWAKAQKYLGVDKKN